MKINELINEAAAKGGAKLPAQIELGGTWAASAPNSDAKKAIMRKAKTKFDALKAAHPDKLRFKTVSDANKYMMSMEYPGWPMYSSSNTARGKERSEPVDYSDWKEPEPDDIQITDAGKGRISISVAAQRGPVMAIIRSIAWAAKKAGLEPTGKTGTPVNANFKSNTVLVKASMAEAEKLVAKAKKQKADYNKKKADDAAYNADPEVKKARNKFNYELQKERKEKLYSKYGKEIVDRVKIKPLIEDGDDGYQWALIVDGKVKERGLTQSQAYSAQVTEWNYMLKISKMTPEELKREADAAEGLHAYFLLDRMEKQLKMYLRQINSIAKTVVDSGNAAKSTIKKAKDSADPVQQYKDLMDRLRKKL